jgi:hypothetical protein
MADASSFDRICEKIESLQLASEARLGDLITGLSTKLEDTQLKQEEINTATDQRLAALTTEMEQLREAMAKLQRGSANAFARACSFIVRLAQAKSPQQNIEDYLDDIKTAIGTPWERLYRMKTPAGAPSRVILDFSTPSAARAAERALHVAQLNGVRTEPYLDKEQLTYQSQITRPVVQAVRKDKRFYVRYVGTAVKVALATEGKKTWYEIDTGFFTADDLPADSDDPRLASQLQQLFSTSTQDQQHAPAAPPPAWGPATAAASPPARAPVGTATAGCSLAL